MLQLTNKQYQEFFGLIMSASEAYDEGGRTPDSIEYTKAQLQGRFPDTCRTGKGLWDVDFDPKKDTLVFVHVDLVDGGNIHTEIFWVKTHEYESGAKGKNILFGETMITFK